MGAYVTPVGAEVLREDFLVIEIRLRIKDKGAPYVVFVMQEIERMNKIVGAIRTQLSERESKAWAATAACSKDVSKRVWVAFFHDGGIGGHSDGASGQPGFEDWGFQVIKIAGFLLSHGAQLVYTAIRDNADVAHIKEDLPEELEGIPAAAPGQPDVDPARRDDGEREPEGGVEKLGGQPVEVTEVQSVHRVGHLPAEAAVAEAHPPEVVALHVKAVVLGPDHSLRVARRKLEEAVRLVRLVDGDADRFRRRVQRFQGGKGPRELRPRPTRGLAWDLGPKGQPWHWPFGPGPWPSPGTSIPRFPSPGGLPKH